MSAIPKEVWEDADKWCEDIGKTTYEIVAKAIWYERQRCGKIADKYDAIGSAISKEIMEGNSE